MLAAVSGHRQRQSLPVDDQMPLAGGAAAIHRAWPSLRAPFFAGAIEESTSSLASSTAPARSSSTRKETSSRVQTPACCQCLSLRQQVTPETPSSLGTARQGRPEKRTIENPLQAAPVVDRQASGIAKAALCRRQQRCHPLPQPIRDPPGLPHHAPPVSPSLTTDCFGAVCPVPAHCETGSWHWDMSERGALRPRGAGCASSGRRPWSPPRPRREGPTGRSRAGPDRARRDRRSSRGGASRAAARRRTARRA